MTQLEKDQKLADLKAKIQMMEDEYRAVDATPVTTYKVWEPADGDFAWWSTTVEGDNIYQSDCYSTLAATTGIFHPTKEAAERHHSFLVMLRELEKFAVEHNEGWKPDWKNDDFIYEIAFDCRANKLVVVSLYSQGSIVPLFKSGELAQKAIATFGDRLKILFEYYNS